LPGWDRDDYSISQPYGDAWCDAGDVAVLVIPSLLSPYKPNVLINQFHSDARRIGVAEERRATSMLGCRGAAPRSAAPAHDGVSQQLCSRQ
jgi:RES domain-containing protein